MEDMPIQDICRGQLKYAQYINPKEAAILHLTGNTNAAIPDTDHHILLNPK